jgi:hypothetical protein
MLKIGIIFVAVLFWLWIFFEIYSAPMMDESGRITKPGKKLSDLWRKRD